MGPAPSASSTQRLMNIAGAVSSVALVIGLCVWGYKLAVRDIQGVPVVRAVEGPARISPEDPGGELARHVGLSVNAVAGTGLTAPGPDEVTLAPDPPNLAGEDLPMGELVATQAVARLPQTDDASAEDLAAEDDDMVMIDGEDGVDTPDLEIIAASVPGVSRSPRPLKRPGGRDLEAEAAAMAVAASFGGGAAAAAPVEIDPGSLSEGTRLVQLGAFDSPELARAEWDRVAQRFGSLMDGKQRVLQEAASGGRDFWRLRVVGFDDVDSARRFCAALVAEGSNCIPAKAR
ncbi:hypothetical protein BFP70_15990 [Thioclava sp. SK-1]|nr:hypothetical protein BFP70_15990 [Thioclava sp. SK-1]